MPLRAARRFPETTRLKKVCRSSPVAHLLEAWANLQQKRRKNANEQRRIGHFDEVIKGVHRFDSNLVVTVSGIIETGQCCLDGPLRVRLCDFAIPRSEAMHRSDRAVSPYR